MQVEILFLAFNRLEFTTRSWSWLIAHTNWESVSKVVVYDDGSIDGTDFWLSERIVEANRAGELPPIEMHHTKLKSPVAIMQDYLGRTDAELFAKIDNDVGVPPGWLDNMLGVMRLYPEVELLGMEAGMTEVAGRDGAPWDGIYGYEPASNIGGVGVMRTAAFEGRYMKPNGRYGFTEFQHHHNPVRGWIKPDLPVVLMDRLPMEPFASCSREYVFHGWQRDWAKWGPESMMSWAYEWIGEAA